MIAAIGQLHRVAECLYRFHTGKHYALIKIGGKQIKRSLKPHDQQLAKRRLKDIKDKAVGLALDPKKLDFEAVAQRWLALQKIDLKPSSYTKQHDPLSMQGQLKAFLTSVPYGTWPNPPSGPSVQ
jgi:hypothetical protein